MNLSKKSAYTLHDKVLLMCVVSICVFLLHFPDELHDRTVGNDLSKIVDRSLYFSGVVLVF